MTYPWVERLHFGDMSTCLEVNEGSRVILKLNKAASVSLYVSNCFITAFCWLRLGPVIIVGPLKSYSSYFFKMCQYRPLFVYFHSFLVTISIQIEKSIDGVLGIRTRGCRMVGADETTELWRPPHYSSY